MTHLRTRYTCPTIDSSISDIEVEFKDILFDLMSDVSAWPTKPYAEHIDPIWDSFKDYVTDSFEEVRKTNENLRNEAEEIIEDLNDQVDELTKENDNLAEEIDNLTEGIDNLTEDNYQL